MNPETESRKPFSNKGTYEIRFRGRIISEWAIPAGWLPHFGSLLAVRVNGRYEGFYAESMGPDWIQVETERL